MTLFGDIIDADQIEQAVVAHIKGGIATYLDEVAQQRGRARGTYPRPKSYTTTNEFDKWPEDQLPCVLVISTGTVDAPSKQGNGKYRGDWYIALAVIVSARNQRATNTLAKRYIAAMRALLLQRADFDGRLGGRMAVREWVSEDYDDLPPEGKRTLAAGKLIFTVQVRDVVHAYGGPSGPLAPPDEDGVTPDYGDWPTADTLIVGASAGTLDTEMTPDVTTQEEQTP